MSGLVRGITNTFGITRDKTGETAAGEAIRGARSAQGEVTNAFGLTEEDLRPFIDQGLNALPGIQQGQTAQGLDERLAEIFNTGTFQNLVDERQRAVAGRDAATGNFRSGSGRLNAANVPTEIGLALEQLLTNRLGQSADTGLNTAQNLGIFRENKANSIASGFRNIGQLRAQSELSAGQSKAQQASNFLQTAGNIGKIFFSDPRLKENIQEIGEVNGLKIYQWDWIPAFKAVFPDNKTTIGFMSDEVKQKYSHHVSTFGGFDIIDYPNLLDELEAA